MLKVFYKTLLITILSGSLLILDFSAKGIAFSEVRAETVKTEGVGDGDMLSSLTMTAVGILASRLMKCKMTTDMMLAAAGGAAYVAGEILAYSDLKKVMKDLETEIKRDAKGNPDREQLAALERLRDSYEKAKNAAETKKTMQTLAAAAFAAAAVAAYMQATAEEAAINTCRAAIGSAQAAAAAEASATVGVSACTAAAGALAGMIPAPDALQATTLVPAPSATLATQTTSAEATFNESLLTAAGACASAQGIVKACAVIDTTYLTTKGVCPVALTVDNILGIKPNVLYAENFTPIKPKFSVSSFFMSEAHADLFSPMGIASGIAINYIIGTATNIGVMIDVIMFSPMNRAIVWGVLSALTLASMNATDNVIKKIEANIKKITAILEEINKKGGGTKGTSVALNNGQTNSATDTKATTNMVAKDVSGRIIYSSSTAKAKLPCVLEPESEKCNSFLEKIKSAPEFQSFPPDMQAMVLDLGKGIDQVNGSETITDGNIGTINSLLASAGGLHALMAKQKEAMQAILTKQGSKVNLNEEGAKFSKSLNAIMMKGLEDKKITLKQMASYMGSGLFGQENSKSEPAKVIAKKTESKTTVKKAVVPVTHVGALSNGHLPSSAAQNVEGLTIKNGLETAPENKNAGTAKDKYEINNLDISTDKNNSIFQLVSDRYLKSAFPRLFDKEKKEEKLEEKLPLKK